MKSLKEVLTQKNIGCGYLYAYIHFVVEVVCFYFLTVITDGASFIWLIPFIYDGLAFVPQSLIGYINDLYPKLRVDYFGVILLFIAVLLFSFTSLNIFIPLVILCLGNCCLHISGAENTLRNSGGHLSHSAIFVAGGSFGVITGKLLASTAVPSYLLSLLVITMIPFIMLSNTYKSDDNDCFDYHNKKIPVCLIILGAFLVVIIRGYVGYGIPTSWNKTIIQTVLLYFTMGLGKALGGILSDLIGIRKVAFISCLVSIPFLCIGNNLMIVSLIGVMMFSMTMSITLAILASVLRKRFGLAFGITTIGLFLGTAPIFFIKITNVVFNYALIIFMSLLCMFILLGILKKEDKK